MCKIRDIKAVSSKLKQSAQNICVKLQYNRVLLKQNAFKWNTYVLEMTEW